ncbi:MAG: peptidoglycan-binding protein [Rhodospirillales bacterium]|nr:MAG: peptidoglycan-binding protein [Rhodospirillales bacterium]
MINASVHLGFFPKQVFATVALVFTIFLPWAEATASSVEQSLAAAITAREPDLKRGPGAIAADDMRAVYASRGFRPLWVDRDGLTAAGQALEAVLDSAAEDGLDPARYALLPAGLPGTPGGIAEAELDATLMLLRFAKDLATGRPALRRQAPEHHIEAPTLDLPGVLAAAAAAPDVGAYLRSLAPPHPAYQRLRAALAEHRARAADGAAWPAFPDGPTLRRGDSDERVRLLRDVLARTGDGGPATMALQPALFDGALEDAVTAFQERHGLTPDGVVGPKTRAALDVSLAARIRQIEINMERWRWMPRDLGEPHVLVNMAGFELSMVEGGDEVLGMRVVVGLPYRSTPVFSGKITYLEFNPYWNIPHSIATKDMLPRVQQDPSYFDAQGIRVFTGWGSEALELDPWMIDWWAFSRGNFPFRLRQDPGPKNALGRVKFMFPNRFAVYLHDTPSPELFRRAVRTFSSGCIRVEKPADLAHRLLAHNRGWSPERIAETMQGGPRRIVTLNRPVPVHLTYLTAWSSADGTVHFRDDIYGRDAVLSNALVARSG